MFDRITIEQDDNIFEIYPDGVVYYTEGYDTGDSDGFIPGWVFAIRDKIQSSGIGQDEKIISGLMDLCIDRPDYHGNGTIDDAYVYLRDKELNRKGKK